MAAEDRAKLRDILIAAATPVLAPRRFDLIVDEAGIALQLEDDKTQIASAKEIADGSFKATFAGRLCKAAGIEDRDIGEEIGPPHEQGAVRGAPSKEAPIPQLNPLPPLQTRATTPPRRATKTNPTIPPIHVEPMPTPRWVRAAAEETGTVAPPVPEIHPVCAPTMRLTRRAQSILDEIQARHRE